ncbi:hypothetical protein AMTR_s00002p00254130 [Amborella trichopoda]|uniref:Uncharacterized protein n=1 Tax=Amborella trichopoda TaxID=13333 RepID=W1P2X9_AMBTC|nr:hypothetical protein AMTR_s00002p00254130 [Amborella trichopoda]
MENEGEVTYLGMVKLRAGSVAAAKMCLGTRSVATWECLGMTKPSMEVAIHHGTMNVNATSEAMGMTGYLGANKWRVATGAEEVRVIREQRKMNTVSETKATENPLSTPKQRRADGTQSLPPLLSLPLLSPSSPCSTSAMRKSSGQPSRGKISRPLRLRLRRRWLRKRLSSVRDGGVEPPDKTVGEGGIPAGGGRIRGGGGGEEGGGGAGALG